MLKKYNYSIIPSNTSGGYPTLSYAKFSLGDRVTFGDLFISNGINCRKLKNFITFTYLTTSGIYGDEGSTDTILNSSIDSLGFANNENGDTCGVSSSLVMKTWLSRHILSYVHTVSGRDTVRCQSNCWGSAPYSEEVIWSIR